MALPVVHYLVYRVQDTGFVDWEEPDGGLVLYLDDVPFLHRIAERRYHCDPGERLIIEEADTPEDRWKAVLLATYWEHEQREFTALMEVA